MEGQARQLASHPLFGLAQNAANKAGTILSIIILAALNRISIEMQAEEISPDCVFYHLNWKLGLEQVENFMKEAVRRSATLIKRRFGNRRFAIAMDYTDEMYYGDKKNCFVVGTKPKDGAYYAYKYFTVSIVTEGARFFLFCYPVFDRSTPHVFFINRALLFLREIGIRPHLLLLDREFNTVDVFAMLGDERIKYIIPADHDGKFQRKTEEAGKFPAIFTDWQLTNADHETIGVNLIVLERVNERGEKTLHGFFTNLPKTFYAEDVEILADQYSRRWGIETSHREQDKFRVKTTSVNGFVHYLFFVVGVLLYNLWVELNLTLCESVSDYSIRVRLECLRRFLLGLLERQPR